MGFVVFQSLYPSMQGVHDRLTGRGARNVFNVILHAGKRQANTAADEGGAIRIFEAQPCKWQAHPCGAATIILKSGELLRHAPLPYDMSRCGQQWKHTV